MTQNQYLERTKAISERKIQQATQRATATTAQGGQELCAYLEAIRARVKIKTLENYANHLSKLITELKTPPSKLTNKQLRAYFQRIAGLSQGTRYSRYQALRSYFCDYQHYDRQMDGRHVSKWEHLMENIGRPNGSGRRNLSRADHLKPEEIDRLLNACRNPRDKAFLMVLLETGARLGEILSMEVRDINFEASPVEIKIQHSKTEEKAGKRTVYLFRGAPLLRTWIDAHPLNTTGRAFLKSSAPVWISVNGPPTAIVPNTANRILELVKERAGMKDRRLFAHLFRHSRASDLKDIYGLDVREIQDWLGHTRIETTSGYLTVDKKRVLQKLAGETDKEQEERRQFAIAQGMPVPCPCGVSNDPESTFCRRCGRVVNREHIEQQASELASLKEQVETIAQALARVESIETLRKALALKAQ